MITNGFTYIEVMIFIAAMLVLLQKYTKSKFFDFVPPIVLLYLLTMILCTCGGLIVYFVAIFGAIGMGM